jgi:hypothetical protein
MLQDKYAAEDSYYHGVPTDRRHHDRLGVAYEALVRGTEGQSAGEVLFSVDPDMIYEFDQACRMKAIELAGRLFGPDADAKLSINFKPSAVYEPDACIRASLAAARRVGLNAARLPIPVSGSAKASPC